MLNLFRNILLGVLVTNSALSADVNGEPITAEMEFEILNQKDIAQSLFFCDGYDPIALHTLQHVSHDHRHITLTDGSVWKVGYFWRGRLETWCQYDQLRMTIHLANSFNLIKIENINQHSVVWGNLHLRSDFETLDARWIVDTYLDNLIELNDGSIFRVMREYSPNLSGWGPGDTMFILSNDDLDFPYMLWNLTWGNLIPCEIYMFPPISN
jgi:hypothetical protein